MAGRSDGWSALPSRLVLRRPGQTFRGGSRAPWPKTRRPSRRRPIAPSRASRLRPMARPETHAAERDARRLALAALFEAEFGQHTAHSSLERELSAEGVAGPAAD